MGKHSRKNHQPTFEAQLIPDMKDGKVVGMKVRKKPRRVARFYENRPTTDPAHPSVFKTRDNRYYVHASDGSLRHIPVDLIDKRKREIGIDPQKQEAKP